MKKKIIITGISSTLNNGCWAMADSTMSLFTKHLPDVEFFYLTDYHSNDPKRLEARNRTFFYRPWTKVNIPKIRVLYSYFCAFVICINMFLIRRLDLNIFYKQYCKILKECDAVIDLSGDSISTDYNDYSVFFQMLPLLCAYIINKPYVFYAQSIGPFKKGWLYTLVKFILRKSPLITAREEITVALLKEQSIEQNVRLTSDSAFLLEFNQSDIEQIEQEFHLSAYKKRLAVSMSGLIGNYFKDSSMTQDVFSKEIADLLDLIVDKYDLDIIFIPHVMKGKFHDVHASSMVINKMRHRNRATVLDKEYNAAQFKAIISTCECMIACRMHAAIAAFSQCIPTLIFAYNHKTHGIVGKMLGMEKLIIDIRKIDIETFRLEAKKKAEYLIENVSVLKDRLRYPVSIAKEKAMQNFFLCRDLL